MFQVSFIVSALVTSIGLFTPAKQLVPPTHSQLAAITARGRLLAQYDAAASQASDAVLAAKPAKGLVKYYIAQKTPTGWVVGFGRLSASQTMFLLAFDAQQQAGTSHFGIHRHQPPKEETGFFYFAAKAIETALASFPKENRPYNTAVLPAPAGKIWVYIYPAQVKPDAWPLGGDRRYLISQNGTRIIAMKRLHGSILEMSLPKQGPLPEAGYHTNRLENTPTETDVFYVLARTPKIPEYVTTKQFVYRIRTDGTIDFMGSTRQR